MAVQPSVEGELKRLYAETARCTRCHSIPQIGDLVRRGGLFIFVPPHVERPPHTFLLLGWEPFGAWERNPSLARRKVDGGYVNFHAQRGDYLLHYAVERHLLGLGDGYFITDVAKCAMVPGDICEATRSQRIRKCFVRLEEEVRLMRPRCVVSIGAQPAQGLSERGLGLPVPVVPILHHSRTNIPHRQRLVRDNPVAARAYQALVASKTALLLDFNKFVDARLEAIRVANNMREDVYSELRQGNYPIPALTEPDLMLLAVYQLQLGTIATRYGRPVSGQTE
ncbi:MAG: uracil-DNA glycosylase family protein [Bacillota bacterium]